MYVCLSVAYIGPKYENRAAYTKIGTEVAHVTRDSDITFKVKRSKVKVTRTLCSSPCRRVRRLQPLAWERVGRGKLLLRCRLLGGARRFGANGEERGGGISWRPPAYSLLVIIFIHQHKR